MRRVVVIVLLGLGAVWAAPPAGAAPISACTHMRGTVVAVSFGHWGGPVAVGCGTRQTTSFALLHAAGFTTAGDLHDGPAFICRLGDRAFHAGRQYPTANEEDCVDTPPASAYWSYWLAAAGQNTWSYSELGAMAEKPKPGEVELWTFGGTNIAGTHGSGVPPFTPDQLRAFVDARDGDRDGAGTRSSGVSGPRIVSAQVTSVSSASGSALPTIVGVCVIALLGGAALLTVRRRRREG